MERGKLSMRRVGKNALCPLPSVAVTTSAAKPDRRAIEDDSKTDCTTVRRK